MLKSVEFGIQSVMYTVPNFQALQIQFSVFSFQIQVLFVFGIHFSWDKDIFRLAVHSPGFFLLPGFDSHRYPNEYVKTIQNSEHNHF